jgi:hypothetical protein
VLRVANAQVSSEAGRVGFYQGYFFITRFAGNPNGAKFGSRVKKDEEVSGVCWEPKHFTRRRSTILQAARRQSLSQLTHKLGRIDEGRQQAPSTWHWVRNSARVLFSHVRRTCNH